MSDDLLKRATAALAEEYDGASAAPGATRSRVLSAVADQRRKGRKRATWGIPLLVVLSGSTAWAGASGKLPAPVQAVVDEVFQRKAPVELADNAASSSANKPAGRGVSSPGDTADKPSVDPPALDDTPALVDPPAPADQQAAGQHASADGAAPVAAPLVPARSESTSRTQAKPPAALDGPTVAQAPQKSPELELYKEAHRAHFDRSDHAAAERGYARYLAAAPGGIFAAEARYNRGVCLIHLGRNSEAQTLLRPFAEGSYGGYRQDEARSLLEAMAR